MASIPMRRIRNHNSCCFDGIGIQVRGLCIEMYVHMTEIWVLGKSRCQFETSSQEVGRRYIISFSLLQQPDDVILTHIMYLFSEKLSPDKTHQKY